MSITNKERASEFLRPLKGGLSVLLLHDAQARLPLSRFILGCASVLALETTVLDTDAFYCTNMERLADDKGSVPAGRILVLSRPGFEVAPLASLLSSRREVLIVDDLNSLRSLASDGSSSQQLGILFKLLSYNARLNGSWVLSTAFTAELPGGRAGSNRGLLTEFGDLLIDTELRGGSLYLKADLWPRGEYEL